jgi:hypothetical protein
MAAAVVVVVVGFEDLGCVVALGVESLMPLPGEGCSGECGRLVLAAGGYFCAASLLAP